MKSSPRKIASEIPQDLPQEETDMMNLLTQGSGFVPAHYIANCPRWEKEAELKKKKMNKDDSCDDKSNKKSSRSSKSLGYKNNRSHKARAYLRKELDSEESGSDPEEEEEDSK